MFWRSSPKILIAHLVLSGTIFAIILPDESRSQEVADARPADSGTTFNEAFDRTSAVSGGVIVGVKLGDFTGNVDVDNIQLGGNGDQTFCVRAVTSDGRFSSSNKYVATRAGATRLRISPVTKAYGDILSAYPAHDFAVEAFVAQSGACISHDAIHLPQIQADRRTSDKLIVLVNGNSRTVTMQNSKSLQAGKCTPVKGSTRIAYDSECVIEVGSFLGSVAVFNIGLDDGFAVEKQTLKVALPEATEVQSK
ncbi:hypothetical protein [Rhizobium leguminosarum]|uniref:Uncharacterized protein n=1 Tax=Rhizobium leguminosarum TaxID=384 RepID=A0A7K3VKR9_RHILE|nr:hypothetical protein [Rhizobium leguminosarum]NEK17158.1 hypothetical protein [Rhizobium leguminosarum]